MTIKPHYRKSLCSEQTCGEQANQGLIALWTSSTANFGNFGTALAIFDLPDIFKSIEDADRISSNWLAKKQCDIAAEEAGHVCLTVYSSGGFRQLGNAHGPVHEPADMIFFFFFFTKSPIEYTLVKNWGAVPVPYDWAQLYQGLQTGVVSGQYVATPAIALGGGIWSMHFIGMLAVRLPVAIEYDALSTLGSALVAILITGIGLALLHFGVRTERRIVYAGVAMGLGIVLMHYIGMSAIRGNCVVSYSASGIVLASAVGILASIGALWLAYKKRSIRDIALGAVVQGLSISAMH